MRTNACAIPRLADLRPDDRWRLRERGARLPAVAAAILAGSLVLHVALLASTMIGAQARVVVPKEIPVEIVQEPPVEASEPAGAQPPASPPAASKPPRPEPAAAKAVPPKPVAPQPVATPAPPPSPPLRAAKAPDPDREQIDDLKRELAELKAEQASLKADQGTGPLRDSIRAVALPSGTDGDEADAVSYQSIVFSALAKAKEGVVSKAAGTVGIKFMLDEEGRLVDIAVSVPSGSASLDAEAVAIVRRAAPFPKPPAGAERVFSANVSSALLTR